MEKLCDDISSEILIRLPSRNIAQLMRVCKRWNTLLSEASFIESHLSRSINNNNDEDEILLVLNILLLNSTESRGFPFEAYSTASSPDVELVDFIKIPDNFPSERYEYTLLGAAHGLICFSVGEYDDRVIYIWNPSLSALLTVPPYTIPVPARSCDAQYYANCFDRYGFHLKNDDYNNPKSQYYASFNFRFGFDPKNDDYKILKIIWVLSSKQKTVEYLQGEVYSMRSGCWKLITQRFPSGVSHLYNGNNVEVYADGFLHWLCYNNRVKTILAFDLAAESFSEISLPNPPSQYEYLGVFGGKLCVISCARGVGYYQVYVLDQHGSWVNSGFSLSHFSKDDITPYGFTLKNNFIYKDCNDVIHLYNPAAPLNKIKPFHNGQGKFLRYLYDIIPYVESLVWVTPPSPTC